MSRQNHVGKNLGLFAGRIDVFQNDRAGRVFAAAGERRMMHGNEQCALVAFRSLLCGSRQLLLQEGQLGGSDLCSGQYSRRRALADVRIQPDDLHERRVEGEIDPRLDHGGARVALRIGIVRGLAGAEIVDEALQGRLLQLGRNHPVMIAGNPQDRPIVVAVRIVELLVVVKLLSQVIDDIAEVIEECRLAILIGFARQIRSHRVRHRELVCRLVNSSSVPDAMHRDAFRRRDLLCGSGAQNRVERQHRRLLRRFWNRLQLVRRPQSRSRPRCRSW